MGSARYRLAVDVGGTFTDVVVADLATGRVQSGKLLTTPHDPNEAILAGVQRLLRDTGVPPRDVELFVHATTLVTNTIIERSGAKTALLTTSGFRDILEMGFESRYDIYDLGIELPAPLVPRTLRRELRERIAANGEILQPLDHEEVRSVAGSLVDAGVEAVAVCLLNSYANPTHEAAVGRLLEEEFPQLSVSLSCEVQPEIREFERASTVVANAFVQPKVETYLDRLKKGIEGLGITSSIHVMLSSGGATSPEAAGAFPVRILESGPAAGAEAAAMLGASVGLPELVSFDMGGTTAKIGLITHGKPLLANQFETAHLQRFKKGSGLTIKSPTVELIEIGAGGGSIAHIEDGLLKVGPRSAGAAPGPVCYGHGGTECTVTDADLVLGYLDPANFANKEMALDLDVARDSMTTLGQSLGLSVVETAWGIHEITNENMALAARVHLIEKGRDPSGFAVVAFGGAAPTHAHAVAKKLGVKRVIIPRNAGVMSALGLLGAPPRVDLARTLITELDRTEWGKIESLFTGMIADGKQFLTGRDSSDLTVSRFADMRYRGQGSEITVPLPEGTLQPGSVDLVQQKFYATYDELYGRHLEGIPIEVINWRIQITGKTAALMPPSTIPTERVAPPASIAKRMVFFNETGDYVETRVYDRDECRPGAIFEGPAIVQANEFAAVVAPGQTCRVDSLTNLVLEIQ
jgi:N-methylhydantoinase A/oxoprolinase/acetone carboxylase beta subunit